MHGERELRTRQVIFKVTDDEMLKLKQGAGLARLRYSTWARDVLLREAERLTQEAHSAGSEPK